jgi:2,3-bisphosphoglycerate-dependent phosphoglycerate mutase
MHKLVLLRHGQSLWNADNRFTGWTDIDLTDQGIREAEKAAKLLLKENYTFDIAFTSVLVRATHTLDIVLEKMNLTEIPVVKSWRLNERHYGSLQGLNKSETAKKHGAEQVQIWRRSCDVRPPALDIADPRHPANDPLYKDVEKELLPAVENLIDVSTRFMPLWHEDIVPKLKANMKVLICAHGNSLRALVQYLDGLSNEDMMTLNIPTGIPLVYELDEGLKAVKHYYLGDPEKIARAAQAVANQAKQK